jgi:hypothetical protein
MKRTLNVLTLTRNAYRYEIDGKPWPDPHYQTDYLVDGESLGQAFRFESNRPWFGQTCFEYDGDFLNESIRQLRGLTRAENQFGTNRFVLYRCHCGDDNCGIISCGVQRDENLIRWTDVRFESDDGPTDDEMCDGSIPLFEFDATEYDAAIAAFLDTVG